MKLSTILIMAATLLVTISANADELDTRADKR